MSAEQLPLFLAPGGASWRDSRAARTGALVAHRTLMLFLAQHIDMMAATRRGVRI